LNEWNEYEGSPVKFRVEKKTLKTPLLRLIFPEILKIFLVDFPTIGKIY